ncbi:conserved hypothetical protein [Paenibacillus curdlanolyticus YK9]|uniref:DUF4338 domain-containing protein n=1 Tax=Paenibacillus curdlanolyticus YK9 TaxID=717606 RepID=E0IAE4_9BACL|nr:Druantia anti-phage system protein DruA [Paenibacillus curdlanolyticus]EFM10721.1 conserved hypothetical protein [Paenibacillus curdlanolyticus YK9]
MSKQATKKNVEYITSQTVDTTDFMLFKPTINGNYLDIFNKITAALLVMFNYRRIQYLNEQIQKWKSNINLDDLEGMKLLSVLSILRDLLTQEWRVLKNNEHELMLAPPVLLRGDDKAYLRKQLQHERNAQFKLDSIKSFINKMEKKRKYQGKELSILDLIGDSVLLSSTITKIKDSVKQDERIRMAASGIKPYVQLVDNSSCKHTGYKLMDIWRYFRYTWSIPYKSTPGRNVFYLIRDAAQPSHPVMGIAALGNCVLQLTNRDKYIGWTLDSIKSVLKKKVKTEVFEEILPGKLGITRPVIKTTSLENDREYQERIRLESDKTIKLLLTFLDEAISDITPVDLLTADEIQNPNSECIERLKGVAESLKDLQLNNKRTTGEINWYEEASTPLFTKKRAIELAKLLEAKLNIRKVLESERDNLRALQKLLSNDKGKSVNIALQANRKSKIGSNLMEIIVCGAIPPYNEVLAGKLVSILMCSPLVVKGYNDRYSEQVSEIASRMKGEKIVRDSQLAFLGTTSLYHMGSSQYNRIKIPVEDGEYLEYKKLGETEGFGSVFFAQETTRFISTMVQLIDGGRKINNVFGEGTSPRLRLIRSGLSALGMSSGNYLKHHTRRIVYGVSLASNTREFLKGEAKELNYLLPLNGHEEKYTEQLIDFWRERWFLNRIETVDIIDRLSSFRKASMLLSKYF